MSSAGMAGTSVLASLSASPLSTPAERSAAAELSLAAELSSAVKSVAGLSSPGSSLPGSGSALSIGTLSTVTVLSVVALPEPLLAARPLPFGLSRPLPDVPLPLRAAGLRVPVRLGGAITPVGADSSSRSGSVPASSVRSSGSSSTAPRDVTAVGEVPPEPADCSVRLSKPSSSDADAQEVISGRVAHMTPLEKPAGPRYCALPTRDALCPRFADYSVSLSLPLSATPLPASPSSASVSSASVRSSSATMDSALRASPTTVSPEARFISRTPMV